MRVSEALVVIFAGSLTLVAQPRVGGTLNCSAATLTGRYGYSVSGFTGTTPAANYGFFTSDGVSSFTGTATVSIGGAIASGPFTAKYTLGSNCNGSATFTSQTGLVTHLGFTVNANGNLIDFIETDNGTSVAGTAQPLAPACAATDFSGPYTYATSGWIYVSGVPVPYADAGRLVASGNGSFTGKSTFSIGGSVFRRTLTGTYTVNTGCTGVVNISDNLGNSGTLAMTLVNNGQQALFLNTTPSTVITGNIYRGQSSCSNSSFSGPYIYSVSGFGVAPGVIVPVAYSGAFSATGSGGFAGSDYISNANGSGTVVPRTYSASYTVNSDCSGNTTVNDSLGEKANLDFFITNQGGQVEFIQTDPGLVISGSAQHQLTGSCSNATLSGSYGVAAEGWLVPPLVSSVSAEAGAGQFTSDGAGHFTGTDTYSVGETITTAPITGTYSISPNCTGNSSFTANGITSHYQFVISPDGSRFASIETDSDTVAATFGTYQFAQPSAAIVNAGSYVPDVAPGSLITIFGTGFAAAPQQAPGTAPWPTNLNGTIVTVNGTQLPLYYISPGQIDAQLPVNLAPGSNAQLTVTAGGLTSSPVTFTVSAVAPGVFTYGLLRAVAQDASTGYSLVGPGSPARPGDVLVVYLTGGGNVNQASGKWTTGAFAPPGLSPVSNPYNVTIGGLPATVSYYGLTSGFIGLYQLNVQVPALPAGDHTLVITQNQTASVSTLISVAP